MDNIVHFPRFAKPQIFIKAQSGFLFWFIGHLNWKVMLSSLIFSDRPDIVKFLRLDAYIALKD